MKKVIHFLLLTLFFAGCGGIQYLPSQGDLYGETFLMKIGAIKEKYRLGQEEEALASLQKMDEEPLRPSEKAMRRNFMGAIYFAKGQYEKSIVNFDVALTHAKEDPNLLARIQLNLASSYFKMGHLERSFATAAAIDVRMMEEMDRKKMYQLKYKISKELGRESDQSEALFYYLADLNNLQQLKQEPHFNYLLTSFFSLPQEERLKMLEKIEGGSLCVSYLAYLEAEKLYYQGEKDDAKNYLEWVAKHSEKYAEIIALIDGFYNKMGSFSKIDLQAVGVVIPLKDRRSVFSKRLLSGIESALVDSKSTIKLFVEDSQGSGAVGAMRVRELIEKHHVAAVIGGLFPNEAVKEYQEAKKHGTLFISLSEVFLPKEEKDHLLIEIAGSVESQVGTLFSPEMLQFLGKNAAIAYSDDQRGEAYVNEFWRMATAHGVNITGVVEFSPEKPDYREPVQNILGLNFPRERQEEMEILKDVYALEKNAVRRVQTLRPQVDFDWIFIPAYPNDALQLIPAFKYYDAYPLNIVGGPSWRSKKLMEESPKLGKLYFVGDELSEKGKLFSQNFTQRYQRSPKLIELRGHDSLMIIQQLLQGGKYESRDELDIYLRSHTQIAGISGQWKLTDGLWLKDMIPLRLKKDNFEKVFGGGEVQSLEEGQD